MIVVLDNYDSFTWNIVHGLAEAGRGLDVERAVRVVRNDEMSAIELADLVSSGDPCGLVISPGPCAPREAGVSIDAVRLLCGVVPVLGICLGHQCIAEAFGMRVSRHTHAVHGKARDVEHDGLGLLAGCSSPMVVGRYHSLVVGEESIGSGWRVSAWLRDDRGGDRVVMGLRREGGGPLVEGVQFHPESYLSLDGVRVLANFLDACDRAADDARGLAAAGTLGHA